MSNRNWIRGLWSGLTLAAKLTISYTSALVAIGIVVAAISVGVVVKGIRQEGAEAAIYAAQASARSVMESVEAYHDSFLAGKADSAALVVARLNPTTEQNEAIEYVAAQNESIDWSVLLLGDDGSVVYSPGIGDGSPDTGLADAARQIAGGQYGFLRYTTRDAGTDTESVHHAYARRVEGWPWVVVATEGEQRHLRRLPPDVLQRILESSAHDSTSPVALLDSSGEVVVASATWSAWSDRASSLISSESDGVSTVDLSFAEQLRHVAYAQIPEYGATVGIIHNSSYLERLVGRFALVLAIAGATTGIAIVIISRITARFVTAPVRRAVHHLVVPSTDDTTRRKSRDELATIVRRLVRTSVKLEYERRHRAVAEDELAISATVYRDMGEGIMILEPDGVISRVNPAFEAITSYNIDDVRGKSPEVLIAPDRTIEYLDDVWTALREAGEWLGEIEFVRKTGETVPILLSIRGVLGPGKEPRHYIGVVRDISDIRSTQDRLQHLATHDPLTDLTNRTFLSESLARTLEARQRRGGSAAVLFVDLDHFKDVNDAHGHHAGDELLRTVANRLKSTIRAEDSIARFGGDEFVVVLSYLDNPSTVDEIVRRMLNSVREPAIIGGITIRPSVTAGIAIYPDSGTTPEDLLKNADAAMYEAKRVGRGGFRYHDPDINESVRVRLAVQDRVRFSLRTGEFVLLWQPVVEAQGSRIIGAEALIRRRDGDGLETPATFLPQIEGSSVIIELANWVLNDTVQTLAENQAVLPDDFRVGINVSATEILQRDFVPLVLNTLESYSVPTSRLAVEVTEGAAIRDIPTAQSVIRGLRRHGIRVYLDDFGVGYSSLQYLRELGVDAMKLDRSFIEDAPESDASCSLVRGVVDMAHGLGLQTTVEGVERAEQLEFLKSIDCDHIQGYHTGPPMFVDEFLTTLAARRSPT